MNPIEVAHFEGKNPMLKIGKAKERKSGGVTPVNAQLFGSLLQLCPARAQTDLYCQKFPTFLHRFLVGVGINAESYVHVHTGCFLFTEKVKVWKT